MLALAVAAALAAMVGCERPAAPKPPPLRIGAYYWPGLYWIDVADKQGWFEEAGVNVERVDTNADYFASFDALVAGKLDVVGFTIFDFVLYNARGKALVGFVAIDYSFGSEALVARPPIASLPELTGKKVGVNKGTYLEYLWTVVAGGAAIDLASVELVEVPSVQAAEALAAGRVDAVMTWEPYVTEALERSQGHKLFDSSQIPGVTWSVLAARRPFVGARAADLHALTRVWQRTTEFIEQHPDQAFAIVAAVNHKSVAEVRRFAALDEVLDMPANLAAFSFAAGFDSVHGSARQINDFLIANGTTDQRLETPELFDSRFVRELHTGIVPR